MFAPDAFALDWAETGQWLVILRVEDFIFRERLSIETRLRIVFTPSLSVLSSHTAPPEFVQFAACIFPPWFEPLS